MMWSFLLLAIARSMFAFTMVSTEDLDTSVNRRLTSAAR